MDSKHKFIVTIFILISSFNIWAQPQQNKTGFEFFDHIYTINLARNAERRAHVIQEFKRMGVTELEIFPATDKNAPAVAAIMRTDFVKKYPPCYSCKKYFCSCRNNYLMKQQIGNWLSFINVFQDMLKNNYEFVLITEDDVKFVDNARMILNSAINYANFKKNDIDLNKPILIRLEKRDHRPYQEQKIVFNKEQSMSNACFVVNKLFAESFLRNLQQISSTSDIYIHYRLLDLDPTIQHFSLDPMPAYQLSDNPNAIFYSDIHPKGIDRVDAIRKQQHKFRIEFWEYLLNKFAFWPSVY